MAFGKKTRTGSEVPVDEVPWEGETWTYATVTAQTNGETLLDRLNVMGAAGWEAVGMTVVGPMSQVLLKRTSR
ncbi:MAG: hypothetical protein WAW88_08170 [Nocardioides sp.]